MPFIVPARFEGAPGRAQGGYAAGLLHDGRPRRVWFRAAVPLDLELDVTDDDGAISVTLDDRLVLESHPVDPLDDPVPPVAMDEAIAGRARVESAGYPDLIAACYSCGTVEGTLRTHPGPVDGSDVWAAPIVYPDWAATDDSVVDPTHVWAVVDCAPGYPVAFGSGTRLAFTGWLSVHLRSAVEPGRPLVVVATADPWEGRKRSARSALWTEDGELVAVAESLWIAIER
jgi:hypothetical protein